MKTLIRRLLIGSLLIISTVLTGTAQAAPATCTAQVTTVTTDIGPTYERGNTRYYLNYTYTGSYTAGTLAGATFKGSQRAVETISTAQVRAVGRYRITTPSGTLDTVISFQEDDTTGDLRGVFTTSNGTGSLARARWGGTFTGTFVSADAQGQPTYQSTFSGPCSNLQ